MTDRLDGTVDEIEDIYHLHTIISSLIREECVVYICGSFISGRGRVLYFPFLDLSLQSALHLGLLSFILSTHPFLTG